MRISFFIIFFCFSFISSSAQTSREDFERGLDMMQQQGILKHEGNRITLLHMNPGDTAFYREMYNNMLKNVDQSKNPYTVVFDIDPKYTKNIKPKPVKQPAKKDTTPVMVYSPAPVEYNHTIREFQYLKNGDFETGTFKNLPGWKITGKAFMQRTGTDMYTWGDFDVVPRGDIGGDYWEDIKFNIGHKHQHWITSRGDGIQGSSYENGRATGTMVSDPFKPEPGRNYLSFLISGGNDPENLKAELLEFTTQMRLTGNVQQALTGQQPLPGVHSGNVGNRLDTVYKPIPGIPSKTGHNNPIFRREWWDISHLDTSKLYVIRITDNATNLKWGVINVDDFRTVEYIPSANREEDDSLKVQRIVIKDMVANTDQEITSDLYVPIYGAADLHTHLMSHLSMGKKLIYGAPDIGSIVPAGTHVRGFDAFAPECNPSDERATSPEDALGNCNAAHGDWGADNDCGNYIRAAVLNFAFDAEFENRVPLERNLHGDHPHAGYPDFLYWPHFSSASHQQMWVDWIKRAYQGGMRVMVTLTVNSELLGAVLSGDGPLDDKASADLQLTEIASFVNRHSDFMELAGSPEDLRRIVRSNKLAVIMGMEVDNIGNFNYATVPVNDAIAKAEIRRLYNKGVRYIFPVHLVNNRFGGSAIYSLLFNFSNKYTNSRPLPFGTPIPPGLMFNVEPARDTRIKYTLSLTEGVHTAGAMNAALAGINVLFDGISEIPFPPALNLDPFSADFCPVPKLGCISQFRIIKSLISADPSWDIYNSIPGGQQNQLGLTDLGKSAIREMMRLGMIIDVDHMSDHSVTDALYIANELNYPVVSGHNGMRDGFFEDAGHKVSENQRTNEQLQNIRSLGGVFGVGIGECTAGQYLTNFRIAIGPDKMNGGAVMIGSDVNGAVTMPKPRHGPGRDAVRSRYSGSIYNNWSREVRYAGIGMPTSVSSTSPTTLLRKYKFGNKTWDYNTEGVAHIGLYPDYFQDLKNLGMTQGERQIFFNAADYFVGMWDRCVKRSKSIR